MPTYKITAPDGKVLRVTGDSPPSEAELQEIFAGAGNGGNVDLYAQPKVKNSDGSISTVDSRSFNFDGKEVLLPSVTPDGRHLKTDAEILAEYDKTGRHLGKFNTVAEANAYAKQLHEDYAAGKYDRRAAVMVGGQPMSMEDYNADPSKQQAPPRTWTDTAIDTAKGVRAGAANTVFGGGDLLRRAVGAKRIVNEPDVQAMMTPPNSTAGKVGFAGEQIGEFFLPTGMVGKAGKVAEVAKSGALTLAQTRSPLAAGASAALSAVPFGALAEKASGALKSSAVDTMANSLRATKEWAKVEAEKLAPEMLKRGIGGSLKSLKKQASTMAAKVGANLDEAYTAATAAGEAVPGDVVRGNLQLASDALHTRSAAGVKIPVPSNDEAIKRLAELDAFVEQLGDQIPVDKAAVIKRAFDEVVSKAGLYGPNKMAPASDKASAFAFREAANAFRELLNTNPTIAELNKEAGFWIGLKDVTSATLKRKVGQTGGLIAAGTGGAGAVAGALSGDSTSDRAAKALVGGMAGRQLVRVLQSPAFLNKVSAPLKNALAEALASGSEARIGVAATRILDSLPAQLSPRLTN